MTYTELFKNMMLVITWHFGVKVSPTWFRQTISKTNAILHIIKMISLKSFKSYTLHITLMLQNYKMLPIFCYPCKFSQNSRLHWWYIFPASLLSSFLVHWAIGSDVNRTPGIHWIPCLCRLILHLSSPKWWYSSLNYLVSNINAVDEVNYFRHVRKRKRKRWFIVTKEKNNLIVTGYIKVNYIYIKTTDKNYTIWEGGGGLANAEKGP